MANISPRIWNTYYKFCFERNPWDKVLSHYFHLKKSGANDTLMEYLLHDEAKKIKGFEMYSVDGKVVVDRVFKYEEMKVALEEITSVLGLPETIKMPEYRAKSQFRTDKRHYLEILDEKEIALIGQRFAREITYLGLQTIKKPARRRVFIQIAIITS